MNVSLKTSTVASHSEAAVPTAVNRAGQPEPGMADLRIRYPRPGRVELISRTLFADRANPLYRRFVERLFSVAEVQSVSLHARGVEIQYAPEDSVLPRLVRKIATALGRTRARAMRADALYLDPPAGMSVRVHRYGDVLTTW